MSSPTSAEGKDAYWYWTLIGLIGVVTVLGNTMVIFLIITRRVLHTTANWFILSLSFADLLVGLVMIPTYIINTFLIHLDLNSLFTFYNLILYVSVGNLCVMTGDRYIAITRPLKYTSVMTKAKVLILICIAWGVPTVISLISLFWRTPGTGQEINTAKRVHYGMLVICFEVIPCIIMLLVYFHLYFISRAHARRIAAMDSLRDRCSRENSNTRRKRSRERSNLKVFASVVILFVLCWLLSAFRGFCGEFNLCVVSLEFVQMSRVLIFVNSAINAIVYSLLKKDIKVELKRLFGYRLRQESLGISRLQVRGSTFANSTLDFNNRIGVQSNDATDKNTGR